MLFLSIRAPYAAFRTFAAGSYRPTARFLTPSAAYGLALNLAGVETRRDDGRSAMTVTQYGLPRARIAVGIEPGAALPTVQTLFQQLHNYPVGASGKERKDDAKGNKYNITPARRELLADLRAVVALEFPDDREVETRIDRALDPASPEPGPRYGLPFLGDNAFLIDRLRAGSGPIPARWYQRINTEDEGKAIGDSTRLTIWVDRQDMSRTRSALYAPRTTASRDIPPSAWTDIEPPSAPSPSKSPRKKG